MKEHNYLSISLFVLVVLALLTGGNYLIRNHNNSVSEEKNTNIKIDATKNYIYYTDTDIVSYALDLSYPTIHLNINTDVAKELETALNTRMASAKESLVKLSSAKVNKDDIVYELEDEDIYATDFLKYDILEGSNYLTLEVSSGHIVVTQELASTYLEYYTFSKETGAILTDEEIKKVGNVTEKDISDRLSKYQEENQVTVTKYQLYLDKYENVIMNMLVNADNITYNDTVKIF